MRVYSQLFCKTTHKTPLSKFFLHSGIINPSKSDYKHQDKDSRHSTGLALVKVAKISNIEAENQITTRNKK